MQRVQIADASLVDCMARLLRATAIYYGNSSHCSSIDTGSVRCSPCRICFVIGRSNFFRFVHAFFSSLDGLGVPNKNKKETDGVI